MISTLANKMMAPPENKNGEVVPDHVTYLDGILGGCGLGPTGDPNTWVPAVWEAILGYTEAGSVLDVGCGFGYSTKWFEDHGCYTLGLEGSQGIVKWARASNVKVHDFNQEKPVGLGEYDLGWCSEFLEHVAAENEPCYMAALVKCRYLAITAALPGFGGHHHVNEQPAEYWIERFEAHGFRHDPEFTETLRAIAASTNPGSYFRHNGLFFERVREVEPAPLWTDIDGWLTRQQGDFLRTVVKDRTVLELGAFKGRSTVCMAHVAKSVTTVDTFAGGAFAGFWENCKTHGVDAKVEPIIGDIDEIRDDLTARRFGVVFVDGAHDADSVARDTQVALECLLPGGSIVWHDYNYESVKEGIARTGIPLELVKDLDSVGWLRTERWKVLVCVPHSRGVEPKTMKAAMRACVGDTADQVGSLDFSYGCLEHNFNVLLAAGLGARDHGQATHLLYLHSDVYAPAGFGDILAEEMCRTRAVAISAVVAIKDPDDDRTSTAIGKAGDPWTLARFVRIKDQPAMPQTFTGADVCGDGEELLINTGCMLLDLSHEFWDSYAFHVESRIFKEEDGSRSPQFVPEDWAMSRDLHAANLPYAATWKVKASHIGVAEWVNRPKEPTVA